jgi:hypothetical protein
MAILFVAPFITLGHLSRDGFERVALRYLRLVAVTYLLITGWGLADPEMFLDQSDFPTRRQVFEVQAPQIAICLPMLLVLPRTLARTGRFLTLALIVALFAAHSLRFAQTLAVYYAVGGAEDAAFAAALLGAIMFFSDLLPLIVLGGVIRRQPTPLLQRVLALFA